MQQNSDHHDLPNNFESETEIRLKKYHYRLELARTVAPYLVLMIQLIIVLKMYNVDVFALF